MKHLNEKFTSLEDFISEQMGTPIVSIFFAVLIVIWGISGSYFKYSDTWQLLVNTPTTILELFIGFFLAGAANRSERKNSELSKQMKETIEQVKEINESQDKMLELLIDYQKKELKEERKIEKLIKKK